tara:strand:+ start:9509 stop:10660 length:1152 start_codon:yes stop_codon:yes gene_type:complete
MARVDEARSVRGQVLSLLRDRGPLARIEIARLSGLSATTITRAVNLLADEGVVEEGASISLAKLGRPATELSIHADSYFVVGVQIGVGFVQLGLIDVLGGSRGTAHFSYDLAVPASDVVCQAAESIQSLIADAGVDRRLVLGVGVAVPGPVDAAGRRILFPINLDWRDVAVSDLMEPILGVPVTVEHNVRSMALAETRFGSAQGAGSVAFVYLRTGLGAGLVVEGQPFSGGVHGAIELGHLQVIDNGADCVCGSTGCLETVVSEPALRARAAELGLDGTDNPITAIWEAAGTRADARDSIAAVITPLAKGLSAIVNLLNPEVILLGGALADVPEPFFERVTEETRSAVFPLIRSSVHIDPSSLGMDAGVIGAGAVALDRYFYA